ncbi:MAG: aryl-sulfate sulfotransferase [archaeon]
MKKRGVLLVFLVLIFITLFLIGCAEKTGKLPESIGENNTKETTPAITQIIKDEAIISEEKPMTRGIVDPNLVVDVYDKDKAMDGTTLLPDNHNSDKPRIIEVNMLGEIIWEYDLPSELKRYTNPGFDAELLPNDNILFLLPGSGIYEINRNKEIVWSYKTTKISHDADRLPNGNTLIAFGKNDLMSDAQVKEINPKGEIVWSWYAKSYFDTEEYRDINAEGWSHTNAVLRMNNGNTLVSPRNFNMLVEVNPEGEVIKTIGKGIMNKQHDPVFLSNGNLLFANHVDPNKIMEIDQNEKIVWEFVITNQRMQPVRDANRLSNGNTLITGTTKIIEVTPDKEIVWSFAIKDTSKFTRETSAALGFYKAERIVK